MRTTLVLDDALLRHAKRRAADRNMTVSDVVNEALRESFRQPPMEAPPFSLITYGDTTVRLQHEPADLAAILEEQDLSSLS